MNTTTTTTRPLTETMDAIGDLLEQGTRLGLNLLDTLNASSMAVMDRVIPTSTMSGMISKFASRMAPSTARCCRIPPPCWMPTFVGEVISYVCPGATATLRLRISNCGAARREINVDSTGKGPGVTITPGAITLEPMERDFFTAAVAIPANANAGQEYEVLIWVRGCREHYLRWKLHVAKRGGSCCQEVEVEDCPDLVHHWYDHFYCERPCAHSNK